MPRERIMQLCKALAAISTSLHRICSSVQIVVLFESSMRTWALLLRSYIRGPYSCIAHI